MKRFMDLKIGDLIYIINKDCTHVGKWKVVSVYQPYGFYSITYTDGIKEHTRHFNGNDSIKFESHQQICASEKSAKWVIDTHIDFLKKSLSKTYKCYSQISDVKVY